MKQFAIITWPREHVSQEVIEKIITNDGWFIIEAKKGNPDTNWNTLKKNVIVFLIETNSPLRLKDIVGELKKHTCWDAKGVENADEIKIITRLEKKEEPINLPTKPKKK